MKYAMYLRISQEHGEDEDTLRNHREILTEFAKKNEMQYDIYEEIVSGMDRDIKKRDEFYTIFHNAEKYKGIILLKIDRLARHETVAMQFRDLCVDYDIPVITPTKTYDFSNQTDNMMYVMEAAFAANEGRAIAFRNKMNKIIRSKRGEHVSGSVPYGYKRNKEAKKLEIVEDEAKVIRYIYRLHAKGLGSARIRDILNQEGYKPAKAKVFNTPSIKRIIKNPAYKGTLVFNDRKRVLEGGKYVYKILDTISYDNAHPAIISVEEWEMANDIRKARAEQAQQIREKPNTKSKPTMLKDLLFCGACGRKLTIRKDTKSGKYLIKPCEYLKLNSVEKCGNAGVQLKFVIDDFLEILEQFKQQLDEELEQLLAFDTSRIEADIQERITKLERQLAEQQGKSKKLLQLFLMDSEYTQEELQEEKQNINNTIKSITKELEATRARREELDVSQLVSKKRDILDILERFHEVDTQQQNEWLKTFVYQIRYSRIMPEDIKKLSTRNEQRRNFPFELDIEYI
ncbi:hypothetical protein Q73_07565 [Bacillus coahuilensis m2-6]|uniref:recombinase family protein n=1 Tax=Bacillus coahuilensis TaxID=408580 RepID=UPI00075064E6|nr:recombinase family protein [Bacillus coahuilensis]KUP08073.1 hypothetical protein Q73_07565 [Bacillus coahuilensis m2-6]